MSGDTGDYSGLRVLDLGQGVAAPSCGMMLALHGADVVKVEPPDGDWSRHLGTTYGDHSTLSAVYNRGKRGLALDLKSAEGLAIARELARRADILIESFRPGVAARLGLGYETVRELNPRLLYVSISGFGQSGPYSERPCSDSVAQAFSGLMAVNVGNDGTPHRFNAIIIDTVTGLYAAQAIGTALFARERRGVGRHLDISLAQCGTAILGHKLAEFVLEGGAPRLLNVPAGAYATRDGWLMLTLVREEHFTRLARVIGRPELAGEPRFASFAARADNAPALYEILRAVFRTAPTAEWLQRLRAEDLLCARINGFGEWLADPHNVATGAALALAHPAVGTVHAPRMPGVPAAADAASLPAPSVGEHSGAILAELGKSPGEIDRLVAAGVLATAARRKT